MRYIKGLSLETLKMLDRIYKNSKYYQVRQRAHCLKLSNEGYKISELMSIFKVSRNTIYNWFNQLKSNIDYPICDDEWQLFLEFLKDYLLLQGHK